jgi:hypothetical protein
MCVALTEILRGAKAHGSAGRSSTAAAVAGERRERGEARAMRTVLVVARDPVRRAQLAARLMRHETRVVAVATDEEADRYATFHPVHERVADPADAVRDSSPRA